MPLNGFSYIQHHSTKFIIPQNCTHTASNVIDDIEQLKNIKNYISMIDSINTKYIEYESKNWD